MQENDEGMNIEDPRYREAEVIDRHLRMIRRALLQAYDADKSRIDLTAPQMQALEILAEVLQEKQEEMTIRELTKRMGLAQSTVSGLVERLERKKLVIRQVDPSDRRCTQIVLTDAVKSYLEHSRLEKRLNPLAEALQQANEEERKTILDGIAILHRLVIGHSKPE